MDAKNDALKNEMANIKDEMTHNTDTKVGALDKKLSALDEKMGAILTLLQSNASQGDQHSALKKAL